jgi:CDP-diacylglycerol--glycerol-3-phosphate 3-phosphatidyltransferase
MEKKNLANAVTIFGVVLAGLFNIYLWIGYKNYIFLFSLFLLAAFTDFVDGQLARRLKIESKLGASADRFRDKLLILPAFLFLMTRDFQSESQFIFFSVMALIIFIMIVEVVICLSWAYGMRKKLEIKAHKAGKIKMWFYVSVVGLWLFKDIAAGNISSEPSFVLDSLIAILLFFCAYYAFGSFWGYLQRYSPSSNVKT